MDKKVDIIKDADGKSIVVINDLRFKGRRSVDWNIVENCLKEYIGQCAEITETSDVVYIGADFPDEFAHSKDTKELRGANMYAKANSSGIIREMIEIATNKTFAENYAQKHNTDAKFGWYRYDTRFAIPVYDDAGELVRYNVFKARRYLFRLLRILRVDTILQRKLCNQQGVICFICHHLMSLLFKVHHRSRPAKSRPYQ